MCGCMPDCLRREVAGLFVVSSSPPPPPPLSSLSSPCPRLQMINAPPPNPALSAPSTAPDPTLSNRPSSSSSSAPDRRPLDCRSPRVSLSSWRFRSLCSATTIALTAIPLLDHRPCTQACCAPPPPAAAPPRGKQQQPSSSRCARQQQRRRRPRPRLRRSPRSPSPVSWQRAPHLPLPPPWPTFGAAGSRPTEGSSCSRLCAPAKCASKKPHESSPRPLPRPPPPPSLSKPTPPPPPPPPPNSRTPPLPKTSPAP